MMKMLLACVLVLACAVSAAAQQSPSAGTIAVSASYGVAVPTGDVEGGPQLAAAVDGYLTPRLSVRGQVGTAWWSMGETMHPLFADANLVYNWTRGTLHPYVTAGLGAYRFDLAESELTWGADLGAGVEVTTSRRTALTAELLYHSVRPVAGFNGRFMALSLGVKAYGR